jgi:phage/plasmid-associated DNA primase
MKKFQLWHEFDSKDVSAFLEKKLNVCIIEKLLYEKSCFKYMIVFPRLNSFFIYNKFQGVYEEFNSNEVKSLILRLTRQITPDGLRMNHIIQLHQQFLFGPKSETGLPKFKQHLFVFNNGTFDLNTNSFRSWSPEDFVTGRVEYSYDPGAQCPDIMNFLAQFSCGYEDRREFLRAWSWAVVRGFNRLQLFLYIMGPGGTGKTVFAHLLSALVGKHSVITTSLRALNSDPFEITNLMGKKLISIVDAEFYRGDISTLKRISGGDTLMGRTKFHQGSSEVTPQGLITIVSNFPLGSLDTSGAIERRMRLFLAEGRITNPDPMLLFESGEGYQGKLISQLPGFFNWVNQINESEARAILAQKTIPSLNQSAQDLVEQSNPILRWAKEELEAGDGAFLGCKTGTGIKADLEFQLRKSLYPAYDRWSRAEGQRALSAKQFSHWIVDILKSIGFDTKKERRSQGYFIAGIQLKEQVFQRDYQQRAPLAIEPAEPLKSISATQSTPIALRRSTPWNPYPYEQYFELLGPSIIKTSLNAQTKEMKFDSHRLAKAYVEQCKLPSKDFFENVLKVLENGAKRIKSFGLIATKYQQMGTSPRIIPVSYKDSVNNIKKLLRNNAYEQLNEFTLKNLNKVIVDIDIKACYLSILLGLYPQELSVLQLANQQGIWEFIRLEFKNWGCPELFSKPLVKICVYAALFQGGNKAMADGILEHHRKTLGLTQAQFKQSAFYPECYTFANTFAYHMNNSNVIAELRTLSEKVCKENEGDFLYGPTGHKYIVNKIDFPASFSKFLQAYEFFLIAQTLTKASKQFPEQFDILGHFHDGAVILIPDQKEPVLNALDRLIEETRSEIGLAYPISLETTFFGVM